MAVAQAMLKARGLQLNSKGRKPSKVQFEDTVVAEIKIKDNGTNVYSLRIKASAYDSLNHTYVYCGYDIDAEIDHVYTVVQESSNVLPKARERQKLKIVAASSTVLTAKITDVSVVDGEYQYKFDIEEPMVDLFLDNEIDKILDQAEEAEEIEKDYARGLREEEPNMDVT